MNAPKNPTKRHVDLNNNGGNINTMPENAILNELSKLKKWAVNHREKALGLSAALGLLLSGCVYYYLSICFTSKFFLCTKFSELTHNSLSLLFLGLPTFFTLWIFRTYDVRQQLKKTQENINKTEESITKTQESIDNSTFFECARLLADKETKVSKKIALEQLVYLRQKNSSYKERIDSLTQGISIKNATLSFAQLNDLNLSNAELKGANLTNANLEGADLTGADLTNAKLVSIDLEDKDLTGAKLNGADLTNADLTSVDLTGVDLTGADLTNANLEGKDLTGAKLANAKLIKANLKNVNLTNAKLNGTDLTSADLTGTDLTNKDLTLTKLINVNLEGKDLTGTKLNSADLTAAKLNGVDLTNADLTKARLCGTNLEKAINYNKAIFSRVTYDENTKFPPDLDP